LIHGAPSEVIGDADIFLGEDRQLHRGPSAFASREHGLPVIGMSARLPVYINQEIPQLGVYIYNCSRWLGNTNETWTYANKREICIQSHTCHFFSHTLSFIRYDCCGICANRSKLTKRASMCTSKTHGHTQVCTYTNEREICIQSHTSRLFSHTLSRSSSTTAAIFCTNRSKPVGTSKHT